MIDSVELNYRAFSHEGINPDGDCGPCCIAPLLGLTVKEVYDKQEHINSMSYDAIIKMLHREGAYFENYLPPDQFVDNNPQWFTFGKPSWWNFIRWFELSKRRLHGGLVGIAQVNMRGLAHIEDYTDHWVLIYGFNHKSENAVDRTVLISCPTKGIFEISAKQFLRTYGGYNTIWVSPINKKSI